MDSEQWDSWLERTILVLIGAALGFGVLLFGGVRVRDFLVIEILVGLALLVWLVRIWTVRDHRLLWPPVAWGVVLFAGWAVWRTTEAALPYVADGELLRILTYTALFFIVVNNLHRQGTAQGVAWMLTALATVLCFYGAWQFATASNTVWGLGRSEDYAHRASGSYACPNHFAGLIAMLLPISVAMIIAGRVKPLTRILLAYAVLVLVAGLTLTFSRGGWLASGVGLLFVLFALARQRDYRWAALICLGIVLIGGGVVAARTRTMQNRLAASHDLQPDSRNSRPNIWRAAVAMWRDQPIYGVGPAHFSERFKQYRTHWAHGEPERAHNDYLNALADWGAAGVGMILLPWMLLGYGVWRTLGQVRRDPGDLEVKRSSRYAFVLGTTGGLAALLTHSFIDFNLHIPANAMVAVTWMALLAGYSRYATDNWWVSSRLPWRFAISLVILALTAALGRDLAGRGRETVQLEKARRAVPGSNAQLAALQAAWALEPRNASTAAQIAELYRERSFLGDPGFQDQAKEALTWFEKAAALNPFEPMYRHRAGVCLDWIGEHERARKYYDAALKLDPQGRITSFYMGWHLLQSGDEASALQWFTKSIEQGWPPYADAINYRDMLLERARNAAAKPR